MTGSFLESDQDIYVSDPMQHLTKTPLDFTIDEYQTLIIPNIMCAGMTLGLLFCSSVTLMSDLDVIFSEHIAYSLQQMGVEANNVEAKKCVFKFIQSVSGITPWSEECFQGAIWLCWLSSYKATNLETRHHFEFVLCLASMIQKFKNQTH